MSFLETPRFPDNISYGSSVGPVYNTSIIQFRSGDTQSVQKWQYPLIEFNVGYGLRKQEDLYSLIEFFHVAAGRANGFRIRDHTDFRSGSNQLINGSFTNLDEQIGVGDDAEVDFQVIKNYTKGAVTAARRITKIVPGTLIIAFDGVPAGGWSVDNTTGLVTFSVAPPAGVVITAGFEFDVPAKFQTDKLDFNLASYQIQGTTVTVREIRA